MTTILETDVKPLSEQAEEVAAHVAAAMGIRPEDILSRRRGSWAVSDGRFIVYLILRNRGYNTEAIGEVMGRDHSAVVHGCKQLAARKDVDKLLQAGIGALEARGYEFDWKGGRA